MVKANVHRDYYKDLEISAGAEDSDVKKQYFKLARLYHPDRNQGRAAEYTPKFQAIQEAHEILSDPAQRAKYDADRARLARAANVFRTNVPPRTGRSAYSTYNDFTGPPPRRNQQAQQQAQNVPRADFASKPSTGASRFANFPRPPPSAFANSPNTDAQARANAWHRMNQGTKATPGEKQWDSEAETPRHAGPAPPPPPPPRPTGAFGRTRTTGAPPISRKPGFDPTAQGPNNDERQASGASAYFTQTRFSDRPPPAATGVTRPASEQPPTAAPKPDPLKGFRARAEGAVPFMEGNERPSAPYTTHSGERTYISSDELKRSSSTRDAPAMAREAERRSFSPQSTTSSRHRSASPPPRRNYFEHPPQNLGGGFSHMGAHTAREKMKAADPRRFFDIGYSSSDDSPDEPMKSPMSGLNSRTTSQPQSRNSPAVEKGAKPFDGTQIRPKAQPSPNWARNATQRAARPGVSTSGNISQATASGADSSSSSPMYADIPSYVTSSQPWSQQWPFGPNKLQAAKSKPKLPYWAYPSSLPPKTTAEQPIQQPQGSSQSDLSRQLHHLLNVFNAKQEPYHSSPTRPQQSTFAQNPLSQFPYDSPSWASFTPANVSANQNPIFSFNMAAAKNNVAPARNGQFKSKSEESINTQFAPGEFNGTFEGTPSQTPSVNGVNGHERGRASGRTASAAQATPASAATTQTPPIPNGNSQMPPPPPPPINTRPRSAHFPPKPAEVKFSPDEWAGKFTEPSWAFPPPASTSPTRAASNPPRKGSASSTSRGRQGSRSSASTAKGTAKPKPATLSEPPEDTGNGSTTGYDGSSDATSVNGDRMDIDETPAQDKVKSNKGTPKGSRVRDVPLQPQRTDWRDKPSESSTPTVTTSAPASTVDPKQINLQINLAPLAKVAPFMTEAGAPGSGLASISELNVDLPFNSAPSTAHPFKPCAPQKYELPPVPRAPEPLTGRITKSAWSGYLTKFAAYLRAYDKMEGEINTHFNTRHCEANSTIMDAMSVPSGLEGWLGKVGEGKDEIGFNSYLRGLREDEPLRHHWNVASEMHKTSVESFEEMREKVLKSGLAEG